MTVDAEAELMSAVRDIPDFPKKGIVFKDVTPLLKDARLFRLALDLFVGLIGDRPVQKVVAIESRGFIFGGVVADRLGVGLVPVRKPGKLPWRTRSASYNLEYGTDSLEIHEDALEPGERVLIVDDVIATGGTAKAVGDLVVQGGATILAYAFLVELTFLPGRDRLGQSEVLSLIRY